jgi:hypothetical protein
MNIGDFDIAKICTLILSDRRDHIKHCPIDFSVQIPIQPEIK